jgi:hypothetical protein
MGQTHLTLCCNLKIAQRIVTKFHMNILPLDNPCRNLNTYYPTRPRKKHQMCRNLRKLTTVTKVKTLITANMQVTKANIWT